MANMDCCFRKKLLSRELSDIQIGDLLKFGRKYLNYEFNIMSDNGSQPTSVKFMSACGVMGINQAFTSYNNPKGNADTERFIRTMKEELLWLNEYGGLNEIKQNLDDWALYYNNSYLHSSLKYKTPIQAQQIYYKQQNTLLKAA